MYAKNTAYRFPKSLTGYCTSMNYLNLTACTYIYTETGTESAPHVVPPSTHANTPLNAAP